MEPANKDAILFLGKSGDGKSSMINNILEANQAKIGNTKEACTIDCKHYLGILGGKSYNLIDTPGYLDSEGRDQ
jgi:predicted GTPase